MSEEFYPVPLETTDTTIGFRLVLMLDSLKEVKMLRRAFHDSVAFFVRDTPTANYNYYWIQVGKDHPEIYVPYYNFYVEPNTREILVYEAALNEDMTLKEWRKSKYYNVPK
jgi:hypothetical protein